MRHGPPLSHRPNLNYNYNQTVGGQTVNNGQIQGITDTRGAAFSESFTYDGLGRLIQGQTNDLTAANTWKLGWTYDRYGNRSAQSLLGGTISTTAPQLTIDPASNRIITAGYVYDTAGNMTNDSLHTYAYDAENRIKTVDATAVTYSYNGTGRRVKKVAGATSTVYIFSGNRVIAEYVNGTLNNRYIYAASQLLATITGGGIIYHHLDRLSTRVETDSAGTVTRTFGHLPFGETWYETGTAIRWKFTSYERDSESGLDYAINRFDSSRIGRFMTPDPVGGNPSDSQSWNRYAYVRGQPQQLTDPLGLFPKWDREMVSPYFRTFSDSNSENMDCVVDGIEQSCGMAVAGTAVQCPNNDCGVISANGVMAYFMAYMTGSGYVPFAGPGSSFSSNDQAMIAGALWAENQSLLGNGNEQCGMSYSEGGSYSYTVSHEGNVQNCNSLDAMPDVPKTGTAVGLYHSHGSYNPDYESERFSGIDPYVARNVNRKNGGFPYALATPGGRVMVYYPGPNCQVFYLGSPQGTDYISTCP